MKNKSQHAVTGPASSAVRRGVLGLRSRLPSLRSRVWDERGVALVEFALVVPLVLLLILGMIDFGKAINYWIDETHLANEGARWAAVNKNPGTGKTLQQYILDQVETGEEHGDVQGTQQSAHAATV